MTKEEEIKKQADIYTDNASNYVEWSDDGGWSETNDIELIEKAFIEGAHWADKIMIDKACEWLKENLPNRMYDRNCCLDNFTEYLIQDFKKAMEE